jgi:hypothetical protein
MACCGEIDIMEYKGNEPNVIHGTFHYPGRSGGNADGNKVLLQMLQLNFMYIKHLEPHIVNICR